jgi:cysteinyl-tRNA synthetase
VLDLVPAKTEIDAELSQWVETRLSARRAARSARDFATADAVRRELEERGILIEDGPGGTRWRQAK